jgi:VWFA-related protein
MLSAIPYAQEVIVLLLLLAAALATTPAQERQVPEFRADLALIRLDVSAVDRAGRPVAGLRAEDFRVTEDGRPVAITYFEAVEAAFVDPQLADEDRVEPAVPARRRIFLLVDAGAMSRGQMIRARDGAVRFVHDRAQPGDWVRIVNLFTGGAWDGRIPEDRFRLEMAARALDSGGSLWADARSALGGIEERFESGGDGEPTEAETQGRFLSMFSQASGLLGTLETLLVQLGGLEGRKAVVLISPGFPQMRGLDRRLEHVATLARDAAAAVYFVDSAGFDGLMPEPGRALPPAFESAWNRSGGAQDLAEATGGFTSRFSNALAPALARVGAEMRTYYVLGYVPNRPDDGRFHDVRVRADVEGVRVRTKKGYLAGGRRR